MNTYYGKGANCDKLWRAWYTILICVLHIFLFYVGIKRYTVYKSNAFDAKFGGDWSHAGLNLTLALLICAMTVFMMFLFASFVRTTNYANEGVQIGRDTDNLHLLSSTSQTWRTQMPMTNLGGNTNGGNYLYATPHNGSVMPSTLQRGNYQGNHVELEDDRLSAMGGEEMMMQSPGYDTWSPRTVPNQDMLNSCNNQSRMMIRETSEGTYSLAKSSKLLWKRFQRHFLPYTSFLHLLGAYCLLLPITVMHSQQIYRRALPGSEFIILG